MGGINLKTNIVRKGERRSPRIVYGSGGIKKSDILFTDYDYVGGSPTVPKYDSELGLSVEFPNPKCSPTTTGEALRYCYILWFLKNTRIKYVYYTGTVRTYQEVIKDRLGNCCDLAQLVDTLASQTGMDTKCGDPITQRRYAKGSIYIDGISYNHVLNEFYLDNRWKPLDPTNYLTNGSAGYFEYGTIDEYIESGNDPCL